MTERKQTEISQKYFGILLLSVPQFPRNHSCLNNSGTPQLFFAALRRQTIPAQKTSSPLFHIQNNTLSKSRQLARTADSRERTGAAKAPVCSPAILSIDRFALNSGGKRVPTAANDLRHTVPARVARLLWRAKDTTSAPFTPHSGPHGQTEECCLRSALLPLRPRKVGPGFRMELPPAIAGDDAFPAERRGAFGIVRPKSCKNSFYSPETMVL